MDRAPLKEAVETFGEQDLVITGNPSASRSHQGEGATEGVHQEFFGETKTPFPESLMGVIEATHIAGHQEKEGSFAFIVQFGDVAVLAPAAEQDAFMDEDI